jgi:predicted nucleic acid-binding protein
MICVDASLAVKWVLPEEFSDRALALVTNSMRIGEPLVAPSLLPIEVTNILRRRMVREGLSLTLAHELLDHFLSFPVRIQAPAELHRQALVVADTLELPAVYDAHYVALAQYLHCDLWTDDRRLLRIAGDRLPFVRWLGDYP